MVDAPKTGGGLKIPGLGTVPKRTAIIWGGGAVVVIGYALYARHKAKVAGTMNPPSTPGGNPVDNPQAGPHPVAREGGGRPGSSVTNIHPPHTNSEWVTDAATYLHAQDGGSVAVYETALNLYVEGEPIAQGSKNDTIIHMAIAGIGQPPQSGANGYPPSIRHTT